MSASISSTGTWKTITDPDPVNSGQTIHSGVRSGTLLNAQESIRLDAEGYQEVMDFVRLFAVQNAISPPAAIVRIKQMLETIHYLPEVTATRVTSAAS